jgi:MFS family permease
MKIEEEFYMSEALPKKKNWPFIIGILFMSVGMQIANYGTAIVLSAEMAKMGAMTFYVMVNAFGALGMMLILPLVGRLTAMFGLRNMIVGGILIQLGGRVLMIFSPTWIPFAAGYLIQSIGTGCYVSSAYVNMASAVEPQERAKFFGYLPLANSIGAIFGPILVSSMYAAGGAPAKLSYIINLPITLIGFALIFKNCSRSKTPGAAKGFDFPGLFLVIIGILGLVFWLNLGGKSFAWSSATSIVLLAVTVISLGWLIKRELAVANPAVPIGMFKNKRLLVAFICAIVASAYSTCTAAYSVMWIRINYQTFPGATLFNGTSALPQHVVVVILGLFLGGYIGKKFALRFRGFGIMSMITAMIATGMLYCLKYTGTAAAGNIAVFGDMPVGMILIWCAVAIGGFTAVVSQATFSAFWQSNTPREDIPAGQALYSFGSTGGSAIFGAVVGVALGASGDYTRAFAAGFVFAVIGLIVGIAGFRFTKEEIEAAKAKTA